VVLQIGPRRLEIGDRALAGDEVQMHQAAGGVVDKHQQGALRGRDPRTTNARSQRRPEILVALVGDSQAGLAESRTVGAVAGLAMALGNQGVRGLSPEGVEQSIDLAALQTHQRRGVLNASPAVGQIDHNPQPAELCAAHRNHRHPPPPSKPQPKGTVVPSQSVRLVTSLSVIYIVFAPKEDYRKFTQVHRCCSLGSNGSLALQKPKLIPLQLGESQFVQRAEKRHRAAWWTNCVAQARSIRSSDHAVA
jgi:hypothetical protein